MPIGRGQSSCRCPQISPCCKSKPGPTGKQSLWAKNTSSWPTMLSHFTLHSILHLWESSVAMKQSCYDCIRTGCVHSLLSPLPITGNDVTTAIIMTVCSDVCFYILTAQQAACGMLNISKFYDVQIPTLSLTVFFCPNSQRCMCYVTCIEVILWPGFTLSAKVM